MTDSLGPLYLPGDAVPAVDAMIRVDHAGEYGAMRIYEGQLSVLTPSPSRDAVIEMANQERRHLETLENLIKDRGVRPSIFLPIWRVTGFLLGVVTARIGPRAAMACTASVENVIDNHYKDQADRLGSDEANFKMIVEEFRTDEQVHRDIALDNEAERAVGYSLLSVLIEAGCRFAIRLSTRF